MSERNRGLNENRCIEGKVYADRREKIKFCLKMDIVETWVVSDVEGVVSKKGSRPGRLFQVGKATRLCLHTPYGNQGNLNLTPVRSDQLQRAAESLVDSLVKRCGTSRRRCSNRLRNSVFGIFFFTLRYRLTDIPIWILFCFSM